jgi:cobyrinic acid a,c-diamide synthase
VLRGHGIDGHNDGIVVGNVLASFVHQRDTAANRWAEHFVAIARKVKLERSRPPTASDLGADP